ncbi:acyltransferase [Streptomyces sp. 1331.2]|uniref:acyltransferase n=1 Tax=Streptomyces sp. 1331.2 TaxID=1938835 RepID=UPI000BC9805D|nr:acyltransferase [Streptomyces sp. 1331.2]SOB79139.1 Transferase family protein [Streptomyces sp. 1331.2]
MSIWPRLQRSRTVRAGHATGRVLRCGLMDTMLADLAVSVVLCFEQPLDDDRLATGLARALGRVPVFAGRLRTVDGALEAVCDDSGVPFEVHAVDGTLAEAMGRVAAPGSELVDPVDAPAARTGGAPLLTVRVTRTADGGTVLGCSWHHAIGDLHSFMLLLRIWSAAVEGDPLPAAELVADQDALLAQVLPAEDCGRPGFRVPSPEEAELLARTVAAGPLANRTVQIAFTDEEVARIRGQFGATAGRRLSSGDVLCAHLLTTLRELDGDDAERMLTVPVNARHWLGLSPALVGNLLSEIHLPHRPQDGPAALAGALRAAVEEFPTAHLNLRANLGFLAAIGRSRLRACVPLGFDPAARRFSFSNWSRFGAYRVRFQGQHPVFFSPAANYPLPWVSWTVEGFRGEGYLTTVVLPARLAARVRGADGRAALHRYRSAADEPPTSSAVLPKVL